MQWQWIWEWPDLWRRRLNWRNFTPIGIALEWGTYKGRYFEITCVLMGVGFVYTKYGRSHVAWLAEMDQRVAEAKDEAGGFRAFDLDSDDPFGLKGDPHAQR